MSNVYKNGFTLIEMMIALAIVAILVALALPSFQDTIRKSRRSDAMETIIDVHLAQERWRVNNPAYATLVQLGRPNPTISPDGHYSLAITANAATSYTITATAQGGQASDKCGNFTLTNTAGAITKTTSKGVADQCWRK